MGQGTYVNALVTREVSIAIERFLIAPWPQAFTPARIDISSPPTGFIDMGPVVEDTPELSITRNYYKLSTGVPQVEQFRSLLGLSGKMNFSLWSNNFQKVQFALNNLYSKVTSGTGYVVSTSMLTITTIASGMVMSQLIGTKNVHYWTVLGVADFLNGVQVIHELGKCVPGDTWKETIRPGQATSVPVDFDLLGYVATIGSCEELVIGWRHYIGEDGVACTS